MHNNEILGAIQQAITSGDFTLPGGQLAPAQQEAFFQYLRDVRNPLLSMVRMRQMSQKTEDIEKMHLGEPITEAAAENSEALYDVEPQFGQAVRVDAVKLRSSWEVTTDINWQQIEKAKIQATIMDNMARRAAADMELLAVQGDDGLTGTDRYEKLLKANDGWGVITEEAHLVDAKGSEPVYDLFSDAWLRMPDHLKGDPDLKWLWNPAVRVKLAKSLMGRQDAAGTNALQLKIDGPLGIPFVEASAIPRNKTISALAAATAAQLRSATSGPFYITSTAKNIKIGLNNITAITVDLSTLLKNSVTKGPVHTREIAKKINDDLVADGGYGTAYANVARDDGDGFLLLTSPLKGATTPDTSEIEINGGGAPSNSASTVVFNDAGTVTVAGEDAGAGKSKTGTFIWLVNPMNFIYGVLDRTRVHSFFKQEFDKTQVVMYNWTDYQVEELDAVVKITNVQS